MLGNKKAQVGETVTWIVATIIIIAILIISLYTASLLAKTRKTAIYTYDRTYDLVLEKSISTYFLSESSSTQSFIYDELKQREFHADLEERIEDMEENLG